MSRRKEVRRAVMELINLNIVDGSLPEKCRQLVREWAELHQDELLGGCPRISFKNELPG